MPLFSDKPLLSPDQSMTLLALGSGLASGQTVGQQFGNAAQNYMPIVAMQQQRAQQQQELNKTLQYLDTANPQLAAQVRAGMPVSEAWKSQLEAMKPKKPNFINAGNGLLFNSDTGQWVQPPENMRQSQSEYGLNPQYGVDDQGNPVILQLSKDGTSKQTALPPGVSLSKQPIKLDAGTHFVLLDPITRQQVGIIQKDLAGAERDKAIGEFEGKAVAAAPSDLQAGLNAKELIEKIKTDPNRERGTGWSSVLNVVPGTSGYDFQNKVDQAKSGAFLTAIQQMRGLGALSNAEGQTATGAVTRMNTATSEEAFMEALNDYERIIDQGIARAQSKMRKSQNSLPGTEDPLGIR